MESSTAGGEIGVASQRLIQVEARGEPCRRNADKNTDTHGRGDREQEDGRIGSQVEPCRQLRRQRPRAHRPGACPRDAGAVNAATERQHNRLGQQLPRDPHPPGANCGPQHDLARPVVAAREQPRAPLSPREREVLGLLATGATNREIAAQLHLSPHTVKEHTSGLYRKLDVRNRAEAVQRAERLGLTA